MTDETDLDPRRRRILFRAWHRGTKETDLIIGGFVRARIAGFSEAELGEIEAILEWQDLDMAEWLSGRRPVPPERATPMFLEMLQTALSGEHAHTGHRPA
ncbi:FAD assembly factor SdhE [Humitalea rosea]|nr:succinate dehydrogenase assembly factor 2 [Humitalea rosea]